MKVLFQMRQGYGKGVAGDSMQMLQTMRHLMQQGVDIKVSSAHSMDLSEFDLVHIFNVSSIGESYRFFKNAVSQKKKIVTSPIFIDMQIYYEKTNSGRLSSWRAGNLMRREVLEGSSMLLPNSKMEASWISEILCVNTPCSVVYHGIAPEITQGDKNWFIQKYGIKDYILCVGRLSPIKNQFNLIRAVKNMSIPTVLIGTVNDREYAVKCAKEADGQVLYIPYLNYRELSSAYQAARVYVQPSWFETAGLASLEAASVGTPVVATIRGGIKEYLGDLARYVEPDDIKSIRRAIDEAVEIQAVSGQREHILETFTWEKAAEATKKVYEKVLSDPPLKKREQPLYSNEYKVFPMI